MTEKNFVIPMPSKTKPMCCFFWAEHVSAVRNLLMFDVWWDEAQEPECTLINVQRLNVNVKGLTVAHKMISKAYNEIKLTVGAEELSKHTKEYEAFCERFEKIKAIQTRPEWDPEMCRQRASPSDWHVAYRQLYDVIQEDIRSADMYWPVKTDTT